MGLPNFCYHLAIKEMAINDKIRLVGGADDFLDRA